MGGFGFCPLKKKWPCGGSWRLSIPNILPKLEIALNTGLRRGEQYALTWNDVDFGTKLLAVSQTKNGETRYIPLNSAALSAFAVLYRKSSGEGYVFTSRNGDRLLKGRHWFEPAVREANVKDFSWHCLRHTFASRLVMAGVDLRTHRAAVDGSQDNPDDSAVCSPCTRAPGGGCRAALFSAEHS